MHSRSDDVAVVDGQVSNRQQEVPWLEKHVERQSVEESRAVFFVDGTLLF